MGIRTSQTRDWLIQSLESRVLFSAVLRVGPGETYAMPSQAIAAANDGDTIQIDTAGNYFNDVAAIDKNNLTIEGIGSGRALISTDGRVSGNKGVWVFDQGFSNLTVRNIDCEGARVADSLGGNGAGIRAQGNNLTVFNCRFYNNQDGILGGSGTTDIENSEFASNGPSGLTHNVYIAAGTLIFRYNYSHDTAVGHLLKSRAAINDIEYNRISDDGGTGSYEIDLPNGGLDDIIGNVIEQSAASQNSTIIAYGEEGSLAAGSELNLVNNTIVNNKSSGTFVSAQNLPAGFHLAARNNIFAGPGTTIAMSTGSPVTGGNVTTTVAAAGFVNAAQFDYHLTASSPAIGVGVDPGTDGTGNSLTPVEEYVDPLGYQPRRAESPLDAGAFATPTPTPTPTPLVVGVSVDSTQWSSSFPYASGYAIPTGASQLADLPWLSLNQVSIRFSEAVNVTQAALMVTGVNKASYAISSFSYNAASFTATWTFASSLGADKLKFDLAATGANAVTGMAAGVALDGTWANGTNNFPSGGGTPGTDFVYNLNVLPGDVAQTGGPVNILEVIKTRNVQLTSPGNAKYSALYDVDGNGSINILDVIDVRNRQLSSLPAGTP